MYNSSFLWVLVYLAQLLLQSMAVGVWMLFLPRLLPIPAVSRFFVGFCLTPFTLAGWMLLMAVVYPGGPRWFFLLLPGMSALAILAIYGRRLMRYCFNHFKHFKEAIEISRLRNGFRLSLIFAGGSALVYLSSVLIKEFVFRFAANVITYAYEQGSSTQWHILQIFKDFHTLEDYLAYARGFYSHVQSLFLWLLGFSVVAAMIYGISFSILRGRSDHNSGTLRTNENNPVSKWYRSMFRNIGFRDVTLLGTAILIILLVGQLFYNASVPITDGDALQYLCEAMPFAHERSIAAIPDLLNGSPDGTIRAEPHGFLWPSFLSHALTNTGGDVLGYPNDHAVRIAFQVTIIYMLLAVVAMAKTVGTFRNGALFSLVLLLQVPGIGFISQVASRDAFRIIPLVLLGATMTHLSFRGNRLRFVHLLAPALFSFLSSYGHTINVMVVTLIIIAWVVWVIRLGAEWIKDAIISSGKNGLRILRLIPWKKALRLLAFAIIVGLIFNCIRIIVAYLSTGSALGTGYNTGQAFNSEVVGFMLQALDKERELGITKGFERAFVILSRDGFRLSVPALLAAIFIVIRYFRPRLRDPSEKIFLFALLTLTIALPFTDLLDLAMNGVRDIFGYTGNYSLSNLFIINRRYQLHWYPFAAAFLGMLAAYVFKGWRVESEKRLERKRISWPMVVYLAVWLSAFVTILLWMPPMAMFNPSQVPRYVGSVQYIEDRLPPKTNMLLDKDDANYYVKPHNRGILLLTQPTYKITRARSDEEIKASLNGLKIAAVILHERYVKMWWDLIELPQTLSRLAVREFEVSAPSPGPYRLYVLDKTMARSVEMPRAMFKEIERTR